MTSFLVWYPGRDLNPQAEAEDFKSSKFTNFSTLAKIKCNCLVQPRGIEPLSTVLQTVAMTTSAKVALVPCDRIELPTFSL